jgi:hypothetical protein
MRKDEHAEAVVGLQHFGNAGKRTLLYKIEGLSVEVISIQYVQFQDVLRKRLNAVLSVQNMYECVYFVMWYFYCTWVCQRLTALVASRQGNMALLRDFSCRCCAIMPSLALMITAPG